MIEALEQLERVADDPATGIIGMRDRAREMNSALIDIFVDQVASGFPAKPVKAVETLPKRVLKDIANEVRNVDTPNIIGGITIIYCTTILFAAYCAA